MRKSLVNGLKKRFDDTHFEPIASVSMHDEFIGPRFLVYTAALEMHPRDIADRIPALRKEHGIGLCNITKCCTKVCPEGITMPRTRISRVRRCDTCVTGPGQCLATSACNGWRGSRLRIFTTCAGRRLTAAFESGSSTRRGARRQRFKKWSFSPARHAIIFRASLHPWAKARRTVTGAFEMTVRYARAAESGCRPPCSHSCNARLLMR